MLFECNTGATGTQGSNGVLEQGVPSRHITFRIFPKIQVVDTRLSTRPNQVTHNSTGIIQMD
eukprot:853346-Amorphochlora_amoeboformis.AAC.1